MLEEAAAICPQVKEALEEAVVQGSGLAVLEEAAVAEAQPIMKQLIPMRTAVVEGQPIRVHQVQRAVQVVPQRRTMPFQVIQAATVREAAVQLLLEPVETLFPEQVALPLMAQVLEEAEELLAMAQRLQVTTGLPGEAG